MDHLPPEVNFVAVSGRVLTRKSLERTRSGAWLLEIQLENVVTTDPAPGREPREITSVLGVEMWGDLARAMDRRIRGHAQLLVEGYAASRAFEDRTGVVHYRMVIKAARVQVLDVPE
jgi:single-stranded DNA-binding protein